MSLRERFSSIYGAITGRCTVEEELEFGDEAELVFYDEENFAKTIYCLAVEADDLEGVILTSSLAEHYIGHEFAINALDKAESILTKKTDGVINYGEDGHINSVGNSSNDMKWNNAVSYINWMREKIEELTTIDYRYLPETLNHIALTCPKQFETMTSLLEKDKSIDLIGVLKEAETRIATAVGLPIMTTPDGDVYDRDRIGHTSADAFLTIKRELDKRTKDKLEYY